MPRSSWVALLASVLLVACAGYGVAEESAPQQESPPSPYRDLPWVTGPSIGELGTHASIRVPEKYAFLPKAPTARFLEMNENIPNGSECGTLAPVSEHEGWFVIFEFQEMGYVKDDEGKSLDAEKILRSFEEGTRAGNEERRKRGWSTMEIVGWTTPPHYEPLGHHLEWGLQATSTAPDGSKGPVINHIIKVLGREGVMECTIIGSPQEMESAVAQVRQVLAGFSYVPGKRYEEYVKGDKVAAVGLTGLIVGGTAVAVAKTGLLTKLFKPLILGVLALFAALRRAIGGFFARLSGKSPDNQA
jgi:uncharacterized membrane-anchored protein